MVISNEILAKRNELAKDLIQLRDIIQEYFPLADIGSMNAAITTLKNGEPILCPYSELRPEYWGYKVSKLIFKLDTKNKPKKIKPNDVGDLKLLINIHVVGNCENFGSLNDPLLWLELDFRIEGEVIKGNDIVKVLTCYHLDRHIKNKDDGENEPHPFYHLQFGGRHLINMDGTLDTGDLIVMETPRVTHHPMDLILSIDYLISYFFPEKRKAMINRSREYLLLIKKYQNAMLRPYYHRLSSHWKFEPQSATSTESMWSPISLYPQIT